MKKHLLIVTLVIAISTMGLSANAGTKEVKYNSAGEMTNTGSNSFGSNASFSPKNRTRAGNINRQKKLEKALINSLENERNYNYNVNNVKPINNISTANEQTTEPQTINESESTQINTENLKQKKKTIEKRKGVTYYQ